MLETNPTVTETTTTPTPETATPQGAPTPEAGKELDSSKWAAIAKREQKLVHDRLELSKRAEALAAKEKELQTKITPFQEFEAMRSKDPVAALRGLGFSETDIFNWLANGEKKELTPEEKAAAIVEEKFKERDEAEKQKQTEAEKKKEAEVISRFKGKIKSHLAANKEKYEACGDYGEIAEDAAFRLVEQVAKDTGEVISLDEAFEAVEGFYVGEYERMSQYKKFKKEEPAPAPVEEKKPVSRGTSKTLTNTVSPTIASTVKKQESRAEKRERLINQIRQAGLHK